MPSSKPAPEIQTPRSQGPSDDSSRWQCARLAGPWNGQPLGRFGGGAPAAPRPTCHLGWLAAPISTQPASSHWLSREELSNAGLLAGSLNLPETLSENSPEPSLFPSPSSPHRLPSYHLAHGCREGSPAHGVY